MTFGLKYVGVTYQRLVKKMFEVLLGRTLEAYVDDMMVKIEQSSSHVSDLDEEFRVRHNHKMRLNPKNCVFGVN